MWYKSHFFIYHYLRFIKERNEAIMERENKKQIIELILKFNLIIGIYNIFLYCYGGTIINLMIGSMNIGVWTFFRDEVILLAIKSKINKKN